MAGQISDLSADGAFLLSGFSLVRYSQGMAHERGGIERLGGVGILLKGRTTTTTTKQIAAAASHTEIGLERVLAG